MNLVDPECPGIVRAFRARAWRRSGDDRSLGKDPSFRKTGDSFDLKSIREYEPGDDMRRIDWKLFGRSGRLFIKEYFGELSEGLSIVVDVSASVGVFGAETGGEPDRRCAASIAWMCGALGIPAEILAFSNREVARYRTHRGSASPLGVSRFFADLSYGGNTDLTAALLCAKARSRNRGVLVISDYFDSRFAPAASPFAKNHFIRLHRDFSALLHGAREVEVRDPESGKILAMPWDEISAGTCRSNESALERRLGIGTGGSAPSARKSFWYRKFSPDDSRIPLYLDFFEALYA